MIKMKNINSVIFKWSERVLQTIALIVFGLNTSFAQLPLEYGQSVMTAIQRDLWNPFQDNAPNLPVVHQVSGLHQHIIIRNGNMAQ